MNASIYWSNSLRFVGLILLQALVLQNIQIGKASIYIYPLFLMLLPLELPAALGLVLAFGYGLFIDMFADMDGLHAAVSVVSMFFRPLLCALIEPRGGYQMGQTLTRHSLGIRWFLRYSAIITATHVFMVVLLEELAFSWLMVLRFVLSFVFSWTLIVLYQFIFNPKN